jgi:hypothetical protein
MKLTVCILAIFTFSFCSTESPIKKIEVKKVDFEISTVFRNDCKLFESSFKNELKSITITDKFTIQKFEQELKKLQIDGGNYNPDVRAKLLVHYSDTRIDTLCMSEIGFLLNGKSFLANEELLNLVRNAKQ